MAPLVKPKLVPPWNMYMLTLAPIFINCIVNEESIDYYYNPNSSLGLVTTVVDFGAATRLSS